MLKTLATMRGIFEAGKSYTVGKDIHESTALQWVRSGHAEEDKSIDGPPEKKVKVKKEK